MALGVVFTVIVAMVVAIVMAVAVMMTEDVTHTLLMGVTLTICKGCAGTASCHKWQPEIYTATVCSYCWSSGFLQKYGSERLQKVLQGNAKHILPVTLQGFCRHVFFNYLHLHNFN